MKFILSLILVAVVSTSSFASGFGLLRSRNVQRVSNNHCNVAAVQVQAYHAPIVQQFVAQPVYVQPARVVQFVEVPQYVVQKQVQVVQQQAYVQQVQAVRVHAVRAPSRARVNVRVGY
jgi:hypothetical protein